MRRLALGVGVLMLGVAGTAAAVPCAGFSDVDDTSQFCTNVEWMKGRNITLGCAVSTGMGSLPRYCPNDAVSRLAMAAFMNRLGTALEPTFHYANGTDFQTDFAATQHLCPVTVPTAGYGRWATIDGRFSFRGLAEFRMGVKLWMSTDGGTTWQDAGTFFHGASVTSGHTATIAPLPAVVPMESGTTYSFSISAVGSAVPSPTEIWFCELRARVENRNG